MIRFWLWIAGIILGIVAVIALAIGSFDIWQRWDRYLPHGTYTGDCGVPCRAEVTRPMPFLGQSVTLIGRQALCSFGGDVFPIDGPRKEGERARNDILFGDLDAPGFGPAPRAESKGGKPGEILTITVEKLSETEFRPRSDYDKCEGSDVNDGPIAAPEGFPTDPNAPAERFKYTLVPPSS